MPSKKAPPKSLPEFINQRDNIYFSCVEDSNEPIMITDRNGLLVYVNQAWAEIYGYSKSEVIGRSPALLKSKFRGEDFYSELWNKIRTSKHGHWRGKIVNQAKDGREIVVHMTITPYRDDDKEILGFMGIALDMTEQELLEKQLIQQEKLVTIGELTSGLAHEIGTPVGVIRGRAEMLAMDKSLSESVATAMDIIVRQSDRISSLIGTLLKFSRSGVSVTELMPVKLARLVDEVGILVTEKLRKRNIALVNEIPPAHEAWAEATKLEQVLINLILNSVSAIDSAIAKGKVGPHKISLSTREEGEYLRIHVCDTGLGIPENLLNKVFMPFFTTKPTGEGTGLGLSIVTRLVHEMDGQIALDPSYKQGACFIISLKNYSYAGAGSPPSK